MRTFHLTHAPGGHLQPTHWRQDMFTIRMALYRGNGILRPRLITQHAWDRNHEPDRCHVSMAEVIGALQHRDARIISSRSGRRVVQGYTWDGVCLHVVVAIKSWRPARIRVVTYWDPAVPAIAAAKSPQPRQRLRRTLNPIGLPVPVDRQPAAAAAHDPAPTAAVSAPTSVRPLRRPFWAFLLAGLSHRHSRANEIPVSRFSPPPRAVHARSPPFPSAERNSLRHDRSGAC